MQGLMMDMPLTIGALMRHADRVFPDTEIVSVTHDNPRHRYRFRDAFRRVRRLGNALRQLGVGQGEVIGTLAWNDYRHFELYYALGCGGQVCHTINPRLFPEQIHYIINHAEDKWIALDPVFIPLLEPMQDQLPMVEGFIILTDRAHMPATKLRKAVCYEDLLEAAGEEIEWPQFDENTACGMCYTSGTTGHPKGVLYSHRALVLQSYASCLPNAMGAAGNDVVMPIVPMFHVNAWNIPYSAALAGFKLVFPGSKMGDAATLQALIAEEGVTAAAGVPTVWLNLLAYLRESGKRVDTLRTVTVGGAACPLSIMEEFETRHGVYTHVGWGMTELSPLGTFNRLKHPREHYSDEEYARARVRAGRPLFGIEIKIVDDENRELPWDGVAYGRLKVRGPWVAREYYKLENSAAFDGDGWFDTGDVATIDPDGNMQITDRTKDVIKSGGEWISSIDLENCAVGHPDVAEAAVIGVPHPKWTERPLLVVVPEKGRKPDGAAIIAWMEGKVAKWWLPDAVAFVDEMPHTATGKVQKMELRRQFADYRLPDA